MALSPIEEIFHKAALGEDLEQLKQVVNSKDRNNRNKTPLHKASMEGNLKMVKALILLGAEVDAMSKHGLIPLHLAARDGRTNIVKYFIEKHKTIAFFLHLDMIFGLIQGKKIRFFGFENHLSITS